MSFYSQYKGRCVGRKMYFLYGITNRSDEWIFGVSKYSGEEIIWSDISETEMISTQCIWVDKMEIDGVVLEDVPIFAFTEKYSLFNDMQIHNLKKIVESEKNLQELSKYHN